MKLVCALLSLPTPPDSENPCGNEVNGVNVKLLLLGEHNSGTSTIYKRVRIIGNCKKLCLIHVLLFMYN